MSHLYQHAIQGGTFDHFHAGHQRFVASSLLNARQVTIGLVEHPSFDQKLHPESIESYSARESELKSYLNHLGSSYRSTVIPLSDIYGTSLTDRSIDAIFVTESTHPNAQLINTKREEIGLPSLAIVVVPYALGDDGKIVSSSRIRAGEIDRGGHSYLKSFMSKQFYNLPAILRTTLETPLGIQITDLSLLPTNLGSDAVIISIGDIVSIDLQKNGYNPRVSVVDFHSRRKALDQSKIKEYFPKIHSQLDNQAGTINSQFAPLLLASLQSHAHQVIRVHGEEDLLVLPSLLLAPLNTFVVYGQYQVGMCIVQVTEEIKQLAKSYLDKFT